MFGIDLNICKNESAPNNAKEKGKKKKKRGKTLLIHDKSNFKRASLYTYRSVALCNHVEIQTIASRFGRTKISPVSPILVVGKCHWEICIIKMNKN